MTNPSNRLTFVSMQMKYIKLEVNITVGLMHAAEYGYVQCTCTMKTHNIIIRNYACTMYIHSKELYAIIIKLGLG